MLNSKQLRTEMAELFYVECQNVRTHLNHLGFHPTEVEICLIALQRLTWGELYLANRLIEEKNKLEQERFKQEHDGHDMKGNLTYEGGKW